jgi:hypothetical protein
MTKKKLYGYEILIPDYELFKNETLYIPVDALIKLLREVNRLGSEGKKLDKFSIEKDHDIRFRGKRIRMEFKCE